MNKIFRSPQLAYASIFLLQLKVMWGLWLYKDLEAGDTLSYFVNARIWHTSGFDVFLWSPLYTAFWATLFHLSTDAYTVTIAHRLIIVLALAMLVLALMRRLLTPEIAWLVAAWWVVLPINFDAVYSVHLFALIPILAACLIVSYVPGSLGRGWCVAMLFTTAVLMRNEVVIPCAVFAAGCMIHEVRSGSWSWRTFGYYLIPALLAAGLCLFFYERAWEKGTLPGSFRGKGTMNMCQAFATSYRQRHPEWTPNPYLECGSLMTRIFGQPDLLFNEALVRNPRAVLEHVLWNYSLLPNGLQVLLFNAMSGNVDPDYTPVHTAKVPVLTASILLGAIWIVGLIKLRARWTYWWEQTIRPQVWTWAALSSMVLSSALVIATHRPRPSYIFALGILIMALTGLFVQVILGSEMLARCRMAAPVIIIAVLVVTPAYYYAPQHQTPRTYLSWYRALQPFAKELGPGQVIVTPGAAAELCWVVTPAVSVPCTGINYAGVRPEKEGISLNDALIANKVNYLFADEGMLRDRVMMEFLPGAKAHGWKLIALRRLAPDNRTMIFHRE